MSDGPNPKVVASLALTLIALVIFVPMYYTLYEQKLVLSRIKHTRESNGFVLRKLHVQLKSKNLKKALLEPKQLNEAQDESESRKKVEKRVEDAVQRLHHRTDQRFFYNERHTLKPGRT